MFSTSATSARRRNLGLDSTITLPGASRLMAIRQSDMVAHDRIRLSTGMLSLADDGAPGLVSSAAYGRLPAVSGRQLPVARRGATLLHTATDSVTSTPVSGDLGSPRAARLGRPRWLDPRLVAGLLLVLGSVVLGTRIVAAADDTVPVLAAATDLAPGQPLTEAMVETRQVVLDGNADLYHTGDVGAGYVVVSPVREGELLARSAVAASADAPAVRYVTVAVPTTEAPAGLAAGDAVDVWRTQAEQSDEPAASPVLADVTVTAVDTGGSGLTGPGGQVRVTLAVAGPSELDESVAALVGAARDGRVYLAQVPEASR